MDVTVTTTEVRQRFGRVQRAVAKGQTVTVTNNGKATMRISPLSKVPLSKVPLPRGPQPRVRVSRREKQAAMDGLRKLGLDAITITPRK